MALVTWRMAAATLLVVVMLDAAVGWEEFKTTKPAVTVAADSSTDAEMHWLRAMIMSKYATYEVYRDRKKVVTPALPRDGGRLLVGAASMPARSQVLAIDRDPPQPPLLHSAMGGIVGHWSGLLPAQKVWVHKYHAELIKLDGTGSDKTLVGSDYTKCEKTIKNGLVKAGLAHGSTDQAHADWAVANLFGGEACDMALTLVQVQEIAKIIAADPTAGGPALLNHYTRFRAELGADLDIWSLRGWLYATDRGNKHRLAGAYGPVSHPASSTTVDADVIMQKMLKHRFFAEDGKGLGGDKATYDYGLADDTIGHVRPRAMDGKPDPLNFVPQSAFGQKIVNVGEELAFALFDECHGAGAVVEYGVIFGYTGSGVRPTSHTVWVDLNQDCQLADAGAVKITAGAPAFKRAAIPTF